MDHYCQDVDKFASLNLIDAENNNFIAFKELLKTKSYIPITKPLLDHLLFSSKLSHLEKLLYITIYSLGFINLSKIGKRQAALSALKLGEIIGCSKSQVLASEQTLSDKGYLAVIRQKNCFGQNNRNLLAPLLPNDVFSHLSKAPEKKGIYLPFNKNEETPLSYLERTKQYVPLNYQIFKLVASNITLTSKQKILWFFCYSQAYKNFQIIDGEYSKDYLTCTFSYLELINALNYSRKVIANDLKVLVKEGFLLKQRFYVKNGSNIQDRCDKSLWQITISLPSKYKEQIESLKDRKGYVKKVAKPHKEQTTQIIDKKNVPISDPECSPERPQLNKDFKINKDRSSEKRANFQFCEKVRIEETKTVNNKNQKDPNANLNFNNSQKKNYNLKRKSLLEIEQITEEEAIYLRNASNRDFSCNYMNKLVKKLGKEYPKHGFYKRELFLKYMKETLFKELRETVKANNIDFTFKADEGTKNQEKYLEEIENSFDTSYQSQLKKKIAGSFDSSLAYQILRSCKFEEIIQKSEEIKSQSKQEYQDSDKEHEKYDEPHEYLRSEFNFNNKNLSADVNCVKALTNLSNYDHCNDYNQTFVISTDKQLSLLKSQEEMLLEQIRAVYGNKITKLAFKQTASHTLKNNNYSCDYHDSDREVKAASISKQNDEETLIKEALFNAAEAGSIWHKVSENLIIKYGIHLYRAWFGKDKIEATVDEQNKTLSLKASMDIIASYVQSNYLSDISIICRPKNYQISFL